ncbi:MAG TPA: hypothetical protein VIH16_03820 [Bellilinea sp.]
MRLSIKVDGELVRKGLQDLGAEIPRIGRSQIRFTSERIVRRMQAYPAKRPRQKYSRTGRLFSHWKIENSRDRYTIENTARHKGRAYAKFVVGDAFGTSQAWMHRGRWLVFRDVAEEELQKLPAEVLDQILLTARRKGLQTA